MNKSPLTKKQIVNLFKKQKIVIFNSEKVNLENSEDRFLYENIKSKINLPPFNNSAVDGYAILKTDLKTKKIFFCNRRISRRGSRCDRRCRLPAANPPADAAS